jgi:hypothetical protein
MKRGKKSQIIREYVAAHPSEGPAAVVAGLKAQGITVKAGLVSAVKYGKPRGTLGKRSRRPAVRVAARRTTRNGAITVEQLLEVKKLADSIGGADHVRSALDTLEQLR